MLFVFKGKDILDSGMLEWTETHDCRIPYTNEKADDRFLYLVKDAGVYLMAGTGERQLRSEEEVAEGKSKCVVVYADGHGPDDGHIGGDDYAETIPFGKWRDRLTPESELRIKVTETRIDIELHV